MPFRRQRPLSAVCRHIKLARAGDRHGTIEDAWLAMQIYLWLHGCPLQGRVRGSLPRLDRNTAALSIVTVWSDLSVTEVGWSAAARANVRYHGRPASRAKTASRYSAITKLL
jgi:hypothetical protein